MVASLSALSASAAPSGFWCFLIGGDRDNSICEKQQDECQLGASAARRLGASTSECTHLDTVWSTHYKMGGIEADWFYVTKAQCEVMRELWSGTRCQKKH